MLTMIDYDNALLLMKEGRDDEAKAMLERARTSFSRMGMGLWLRKAEAALAGRPDDY